MLINALKIFLNPLDDSFGLPLAEFLNKPFFRHFITLMIIATVYAVTKGNDIGRSVTTAFVLWNPMRFSKHMEKPTRSTTDCAATIEIGDGALPIKFSKGSWQRALTGLAAHPGYFVALWISTIVTAKILSDVVTMILTILSCRFATSIRIILDVSLLPFSYSVGMPHSMSALIFTLTIASFLGLISSSVILTNLFRISFLPFSGVSDLNFAISNISFGSAFFLADITVSPQMIFGLLVFSEFAKETWLSTRRAAFKGRRLVDHSVSLSLYLRMSSADGEIIRRSGLDSLADSMIIASDMIKRNLSGRSQEKSRTIAYIAPKLGGVISPLRA